MKVVTELQGGLDATEISSIIHWTRMRSPDYNTHRRSSSSNETHTGMRGLVGGKVAMAKSRMRESIRVTEDEMGRKIRTGSSTKRRSSNSPRFFAVSNGNRHVSRQPKTGMGWLLGKRAAHLRPANFRLSADQSWQTQIRAISKSTNELPNC